MDKNFSGIGIAEREEVQEEGVVHNQLVERSYA